jgi:hypothetical protein
VVLRVIARGASKHRRQKNTTRKCHRKQACVRKPAKGPHATSCHVYHVRISAISTRYVKASFPSDTFPRQLCPPLTSRSFCMPSGPFHSLYWSVVPLESPTGVYLGMECVNMRGPVTRELAVEARACFGSKDAGGCDTLKSGTIFSCFPALLLVFSDALTMCCAIPNGSGRFGSWSRRITLGGRFGSSVSP